MKLDKQDKIAISLGTCCVIVIFAFFAWIAKQQFYEKITGKRIDIGQIWYIENRYVRITDIENIYSQDDDEVVDKFIIVVTINRPHTIIEYGEEYFKQQAIFEKYVQPKQ